MQLDAPNPNEPQKKFQRLILDTNTLFLSYRQALLPRKQYRGFETDIMLKQGEIWAIPHCLVLKYTEFPVMLGASLEISFSWGSLLNSGRLTARAGIGRF